MSQVVTWAIALLALVVSVATYRLNVRDRRHAWEAQERAQAEEVAGWLVREMCEEHKEMDWKAYVRNSSKSPVYDEGRNFQFCHLIVNYDLPWNPMRIEQRIGRLDRIGQKLPVRIYNLFCEDTVEERVLEVLERRIGMFQESVGSLDPILGEVERDIERLVLSDVAAFDAEFHHYEAALERRVREAREKERTLADFVLDRASLRHDLAIELLEQSPLARWSDLERFAARCLQYFGGTLKDHYEGGQVVSLSPRLMTRMQQRQSTIRGTFDPEVAREREEFPFFAFGHWLKSVSAPLTTSWSRTALTCQWLAPSWAPGVTLADMRGTGGAGGSR